jgi:hypothetical protein
VRGILFLRFDLDATVCLSLNKGSKGFTLPLGLYVIRSFDEVLATAVWPAPDSGDCPDDDG